MISFVCGQLCSGKTLYSKALAALTNGVYIEVGDIVRSIKNTSNRKDLQDSKCLNEQIVKKLKEEINTDEDKTYVISGVRQKEILEAFPNSTMLWIECPSNIRYERYQQRARVGDNQTFDEAEEGDINLGIIQVKNYIFNKNKTL
jgi:cytidylate kinase